MKVTNKENEFAELSLEYSQLRQEILHNGTLNSQTLSTTLAIVGILMGFAFTKEITDGLIKGILFFLAELVTLFVILQTSDRERATFAIASYLHVFTETKFEHLKWETRLAKFREQAPKDGFGDFIGNQLWIYMLIIAINFILGAYYIIKSAQNQSYFVLAIIGLIFAFVITLSFIWIGWNRYNRFVLRYKETFENVWKKVRDDENTTGSISKKRA